MFIMMFAFSACLEIIKNGPTEQLQLKYVDTLKFEIYIDPINRKLILCHYGTHADNI